jgi:WD40 repeat protein
LSKIKISIQGLNGLCLTNENYLYVACEDKALKLIDINEGKILISLKDHKREVITIKKIFHPKYGEYLISQGYGDSPIIMWINK